jgi:hypothetical protein
MDNIENIAKLRLVVARCGEMDRSKWWNTKGLLGHVGELAISRGLPKTHIFARARAAFAVASARSDEVFNPPDSYTLWRLPVEIEDRIEDAWSTWLENPEPWRVFLDAVDSESQHGVLQTLTKLGLLSDHIVDRIARLRRADDLRSVPIKPAGESTDDLVATLAAAHHSSEPGKLAVPFVRQEDYPA